MDIIDGALKSRDGQHKFHPETTIANVIGLEAQLAKAIVNLTANGGMTAQRLILPLRLAQVPAVVL